MEDPNGNTLIHRDLVAKTATEEDAKNLCLVLGFLEVSSWPPPHSLSNNNGNQTPEELYVGLNRIISCVSSNRDAWPFKEAVNDKVAPMYYQIIEKPMDLSIILRKISNREYVEFAEVESDFKLMVNNCETYNGPGSGYSMLAYAVWKAFKKSAKRYLNKELEDEQTAFIYPRKYTNTNVKAALEARKRQKLKKRKGMKALDMLAQAAELAIKDTSSRSSVTASSPNSINAIDERATGGFELLARYLNNSSALAGSASGGIVPSDGNLTFKSLAEWSECIKSSGNNVILPQHSVVINMSPVTIGSTTNGPNLMSDDNEKYLTPKNSSERNCVDYSQPTVISNERNLANNPRPVDEGKRLVLKLSRCDSGQTWKPVQLVSNNNSHQTHGNIISSTLKQQNQVLSCVKMES